MEHDRRSCTCVPSLLFLSLSLICLVRIREVRRHVVLVLVLVVLMRLTVGRDNPGFYKEARKYVRHHTRMPIALPSPFPSGEEEIVSGGGGKVWDDKKDDSLSALFETLNVNEHEDEPPGPAPTAAGSGPPPSVKIEPAPHEDQSSMRSMMDCE